MQRGNALIIASYMIKNARTYEQLERGYSVSTRKSIRPVISGR